MNYRDLDSELKVLSLWGNRAFALNVARLPAKGARKPNADEQAGDWG